MNRSRRILIHLGILLLVVASSSSVGPASDEPATTIILVRHAEKQPQPGDPALDERGRARSEALARTLADIGVSGLSATTFRRTQETLGPLAEQLDLEIEVEPVDLSDPDGYARELAIGILRRHRGGTVVVAGHSNTVPLLLAAFGIADPRPIGEDEYDDLFVVRVGSSEEPELLHLHYGAPSP